MQGMKPKKEMVIEISPAGTVKLEMLNCTGDECAKLSEPIEIVLGGVDKRSEKPEFRAPAQGSLRETLKRSF